MKRLLSLAIATAMGAAALLPLSATAQTRVQLIVSDHAPARYVSHDRYVRERHYAPRYAYAPSARYHRGGYVAPRRWIDRNGDGMDDRRGRRDLDRDGVRDRYDRDLDNDGIENRYDRDMDGDGVPNRRDRRPDNRYAY
ncbi:hypothetical protein KY495_05305 [Massilia sp. PAMC28688]|uniref:hypothetical protein n=1 Tax=Massilia sp. PAMC28688 TaxID=2861283 RepID=UPI001C637729|nr:hypothetical protein [Massilia sp. PAMC28688]QYF94618.1 hypothetical protein KY495_05305 [Massilia sp. PAMC28688]